MHRSFLASAATATLLALAVPVSAQEGPRQQEQAQGAAPLQLTGRIVDNAAIIPPQSRTAMAAVLEELERDLGVQFVIVSTASLGGIPIDQYALALGNGWGVGHDQRNDGLLLVVAPNERQVRIEVGTGLEQVLPDEFCASVIDLMLPSFKQGNFAEGMIIGMVTLDTRLRKVAAELAG